MESDMDEAGLLERLQCIQRGLPYVQRLARRGDTEGIARLEYLKAQKASILADLRRLRATGKNRINFVGELEE